MFIIYRYKRMKRRGERGEDGNISEECKSIWNPRQNENEKETKQRE